MGLTARCFQMSCQKQKLSVDVILTDSIQYVRAEGGRILSHSKEQVQLAWERSGCVPVAAATETRAALPRRSLRLEREGGGKLGALISKCFGYCWEGGLPRAGGSNVAMMTMQGESPGGEEAAD